MELKRLKTFFMLEMIAENRPRSQREFSDSLDISLGLVNTFIKRLINKGYCTVKALPRKRIRYVLTPLGATEKTKLAYEYISSAYQSFKTVCCRLERFYATIEDEGFRRIVFYGAGEMSEIALLALKETNLNVIAVVDPVKAGERWAGHVVKPISDLDGLDFDAVLVTTTDNPEKVIETLGKSRFSLDRVRFFG
ncbi:putative Transcriptional regulator, MarR family [Desulfosarcina cetonica]|uniref:winged helix-turn-helix transcriptional regulator n=1 Tax=Desulfosarcina cetonica TaxID=90730 RepID=UPI0006D0502F|nr:winged helix-turn-helix transcriptional regulator [Desulfosarcina cetonica]VTR65032.1 putative Transcriptional regulator, MarR family [Desulfosarcina cetonica]